MSVTVTASVWMFARLTSLNYKISLIIQTRRLWLRWDTRSHRPSRECSHPREREQISAAVSRPFSNNILTLQPHLTIAHGLASTSSPTFLWLQSVKGHARARVEASLVSPRVANMMRIDWGRINSEREYC